MALLEELVAQADVGRGHVALVSGEAGIGKTRLVDELRSTLRDKSAWWARATAFRMPAPSLHQARHTRAALRSFIASEALLLAAVGGVAGVALGVASSVIYASAQHWAITVPTPAWAGGLAAALAIGGVAGLLPAHAPPASHPPKPSGPPNP